MSLLAPDAERLRGLRQYVVSGARRRKCGDQRIKVPAVPPFRDLPIAHGDKAHSTETNLSMGRSDSGDSPSCVPPVKARELSQMWPKRGLVVEDHQNCPASNPSAHLHLEHGLSQLRQRFLGVAVEHFAVLLREKGILQAGKTLSAATLEDDHGLSSIDLEDRHACDRA